MIMNIRDLQVREDFSVTIAGTVVNIREDEFLLQGSTGQIWVDAAPERLGTLNFSVGERLTVVGELDDREDFDATRITRSGGAVGLEQPASPAEIPPLNLANVPRVRIGDLRVQEDVLVDIRGRVARIREDEFLLRDGTGRVWVDGVFRGNRRLDIAVGDRLRVVGELDDADFDAVRITRANGANVGVLPAQSRRDRAMEQTPVRERGMSGTDLGEVASVNPSRASRSFWPTSDGVSVSEFAVDSSMF